MRHVDYVPFLSPRPIPNPISHTHLPHISPATPKYSSFPSRAVRPFLPYRDSGFLARHQTIRIRNPPCGVSICQALWKKKLAPFPTSPTTRFPFSLRGARCLTWDMEAWRQALSVILVLQADRCCREKAPRVVPVTKTIVLDNPTGFPHQ